MIVCRDLSVFTLSPGKLPAIIFTHINIIVYSGILLE